MPKRGENIYKRKDNRWEARYIKERDSNGKIKFGYCYAKTYKEAKQKLFTAKEQLLTEKQNKEMNAGVFSDYILDWIKVHSIGNTESTNSKYWYMVNRHLIPFFGDIKIDSISSQLVFQFSSNLLSNERLSKKTVFDILVILKSIINYTSRLFPVLNTVDVVFPKIDKKEPLVLSRKEQEIFIEYLTQDMDLKKFGTLLSLMTGIRIGELCALQTKDFSFSEKTLQISKTMQRVKNKDGDSKTKIIVTSPKSDSSARKIPLSDYLISMCKKMLSSDNDAYLLTAYADSFVEPRIMQSTIKKYGKDCGIENLHFHTMRHTFATRCVEENFDIKALSEILGHQSVQITLERYVHSSMEFKRSNMEKMNKFFEPSNSAVSVIG